MEKLKLTYIGTDDWSRPVFESEEGRIFKDLNCGEGQLDLCTAGSFDGEPNTPIYYIEKYKNVEFEILGMEEQPTPGEKLNYMMLGRLQSDCDYYLGHGGRNEKRLWAGNVSEQIAKMKELYNSFNDDKKPEWITLDDILEYENIMTQ
ncbi:LPD11 domain-containing protein [Lysinibacillus sp. UGB7]|uniref:LPD11 domain-containing protein n=1 Tax=Lysinibacillus sp. UGB7 TaxID=3411039 RepID=UPI003B777598